LDCPNCGSSDLKEYKDKVVLGEDGEFSPYICNVCENAFLQVYKPKIDSNDCKNAFCINNYSKDGGCIYSLRLQSQCNLKTMFNDFSKQMNDDSLVCSEVTCIWNDIVLKNNNNNNNNNNSAWKR
jgi:hypothetical protein